MLVIALDTLTHACTQVSAHIGELITASSQVTVANSQDGFQHASVPL